MPATIERPTQDNFNFNALIWGDSGVGKSTLASTAPGQKLWVQFDHQGITSIANRSDLHLLDFSGESASTTMIQFQNVDPYGIGKFLHFNPGVETVVVDSMTALAHMALVYGVTKAGGRSNIDVPGIQGYGVRNNIMRRVAVSLLQTCAANNRNLIMTTHEGSPDKEETTGNITSITMALSAGIANDVSLRFNEVWFMKDDGRQRTIYVRPWGVYKPMKTRMFMAEKQASFRWDYDADTLQGDGIAEWWTEWKLNGGRKIALPKGGKK
jgi:hypothetical protein